MRALPRAIAAEAAPTEKPPPGPSHHFNNCLQAQYEAGTVGFLNVAAAQVNALGARQKLR